MTTNEMIMLLIAFYAITKMFSFDGELVIRRNRKQRPTPLGLSAAPGKPTLKPSMELALWVILVELLSKSLSVGFSSQLASFSSTLF